LGQCQPFTFQLFHSISKPNIYTFAFADLQGELRSIFIAGLTFFKSAYTYQNSVALWVLAIVYGIFALLFSNIAFGNIFKANEP